MLLARRLIEAGVRFVTIQGFVDTGIYAWDHHWGGCFSLTIGGGGVKTGRVIGASDKFGAIPEDRPVSVPDFVATVYHAVGLDRHAEFLGQGRPMKMLPQGNVVSELF